MSVTDGGGGSSRRPVFRSTTVSVVAPSCRVVNAVKARGGLTKVGSCCRQLGKGVFARIFTSKEANIYAVDLVQKGCVFQRVPSARTTGERRTRLRSTATTAAARGAGSVDSGGGGEGNLRLASVGQSTPSSLTDGASA